MPHAHWHSERQLLKNRDSAPAPDDKMPRSFLIKKHQSTKKTNCGRLKSKTEEASSSTPEDCPLHSDIPPHHHHPTSSPWLQQRPQSLSSSSCPLSFKADILSLASSSPCSFLCPATDVYSRSPAEVHRPTESYTQMDLKFQYVVGNHMRRKSLLPQSLPFLALFPATPPGDSSRESFECLDYHKEYLRFSGMAMHKQRQCAWSSKKFFSCKYCEKEYISLGALKLHIRTHTLPCVCKLCGKAFSRPWLLQGHIRTHTGEKPFSCLHCSRAFADRSNLRAHLQTHSEVKKYQCASCFKTFSRISLLCKHQETLCPLV